MQKPLETERLARLAGQYGTPLWIYDAALIRERIAQLRAFDVIRFAQKACSNLSILRLMRQQGVAVDAVSEGELERALVAGYQPTGEPAGVVFTADLLTAGALALVLERGVEVNAGSIDMLEQLGRAHPGHRVWLRVNPGFGHGHSQKTNTGGENSKHGIWHTDLPAALAVIRQYRLELVGVHMHIGSGVDYGHLEQVCEAMVRTVLGLGSPAGTLPSRRNSRMAWKLPYRAGRMRSLKPASTSTKRLLPMSFTARTSASSRPASATRKRPGSISRRTGWPRAWAMRCLAASQMEK